MIFFKGHEIYLWQLIFRAAIWDFAKFSTVYYARAACKVFTFAKFPPFDVANIILWNSCNSFYQKTSLSRCQKSTLTTKVHPSDSSLLVTSMNPMKWSRNTPTVFFVRFIWAKLVNWCYFTASFSFIFHMIYTIIISEIIPHNFITYLFNLSKRWGRNGVLRGCSKGFPEAEACGKSHGTSLPAAAKLVFPDSFNQDLHYIWNMFYRYCQIYLFYSI